MADQTVNESEPNRKARGRAGLALAIFLGLVAVVFWLDGERFDLWVKALHVIAVMSWMAGMLYLPRLFINHIESGAVAGSDMDLVFQGMEQRLMRIIMTPAMIVSWLAGLWLMWVGGFYGDLWFSAKFAGVVGMTAAHGWFAASIRRFAAGTNRLSSRQWRLANEVPTLLMILIVVLVIVKPWL